MGERETKKSEMTGYHMDKYKIKSGLQTIHMDQFEEDPVTQCEKRNHMSIRKKIDEMHLLRIDSKS